MRIKALILVIFLIISGLFAFALFNLNGIVNKNKDLILSQIEKQVERKVEVESMGINIWGGLGFKLSEFKLEDDRQFSSENFIEAQDLVVTLKILPLLKKQIEIKKVILIEPEISIIKNKSGTYNFESLSSKEKTPEPKTGKGPIEDFTISLADISNGKINYTDLEKGSSIQIKKINLNSKNISLNKPVEFDLSIALFSENQNIFVRGDIGPIGEIPDFATTRINTNIEIEGLNIAEVEKNFPQIKGLIPEGLNLGNSLDLTLSATGTGGELELKKIDFKTAVFNSDEQNLALKGSAGPIGSETEKDKLNLDLDFTLEPVNIENLVKFEPVRNSVPPELKASGPLALSGKINGNVETLNLLFMRMNAKQSKILYGDLFKKQAGENLTIATDAIVTASFIELKNTELNLNDLRANAGGRINTDKKQNLNIKLTTNAADLSSLSKNLTILSDYGLSGNFEVDAELTGSAAEGKTPDINGVVRLINVGANIKELSKPITDLNGEIKFNGNSARIEGAKLKLGSSDMLVNADIKNFHPLSIDYNLSSPEIRLSDLSASASKDENIKNLSVKGTATDKNGEIQSRATIKSDNGKFSKINYKNLNGNIVMENRIVNFNDLGFNFLNATLNASGKYNMQGEVPSFTVSTNLSGLNITDLVKTFLNPKSDAISGKTNLKLEISGSGTDWNSISKTLNGLGQIKLTEGRLEDFNMADEVITGITGVKGLSALMSQNLRDKYPDVFKTSSTVFYDLESPIKIDRGKINLNDIILAASNYIVNGEGTISLDSALDMAGNITLSEKLSEDLVSNQKIISVLKNSEGNIQIPFRLDGNLPRVRPKPDVSFIARKIQSSVIEEGKDKLKDKLLQGLNKDKINEEENTKNQDDTQNLNTKEDKNTGKDKSVEKLLEKGLKSIFE